MKFAFLFIFASLSLSTFAQKDSAKEFIPPMLVRGIGISFQEFDGLNSRIAGRQEYKTLRDYAGTIKLGWMRVYKNFVSDLDLTAGSSMSGDRERRSSTIRYLGAGIDFGYDVIPNKNIMLYPLVGIGLQKYQARFFKDNAAVPFNDVLGSPALQNNIKPLDFKNSFFTYRLGLGFAFQSPNRPASSIGIQVGYTGSFKSKAWKSSDEQTLAGAPEDDLSQFHISLVMTSLPRMMR